MIEKDSISCPLCGGILKYYDSVKRHIKGKYRRVHQILIRRYKCVQCGSIHREMNRNVLPYKQYHSDIIEGVTEGLITSDTIGFEDYPCEATMTRWREEKLHFK